MDKKDNKVVFESLSILLNKFNDGSFKEILDDWLWIFSYCKKYKFIIMTSVLLSLLSASFSLVSSVASKYILDIITGYKMEYLWILIVVMMGSMIVSLVLNQYLGRLNLKIGIDIGNDIQSDVFNSVMDAKWLDMSKYSSGDIVHRFNNDINTVSSNAVNWITTVISVVYSFIATFVIIYSYDKIMALIALLNAPVMFLINAFVLKKRRHFANKVKQVNSDMMSFEVETFYNYDTLKSFGITHKYSNLMKNWQNKYKNIQLDYNLFNIKISSLSSLLSSLINMGAFLYCLFRLWSKDITYGTMQLFLTQKSRFSSSFSTLTGIVPMFLNTSMSAHRVKELLELDKEDHIASSGILDQYAYKGISVEINNIDFSYVENQQVISHSSFNAYPGEIVAIIGPSGEGKTTLIRLILGLVSPSRGDVVLRDCMGRSVDSNADTRYLFSYVPQGNTILSGTIASNMRMIKEDASDEEIIEVLKIACAYDFVSKHKDGIYAKVGEKGKGLSEGQAQRLAIARALLRDAPILLLDEATSALDVVTERKVLENIMVKQPYRSIIVTTHRASVLSLCQRVYRVLDTEVTELSKEDSSSMVIDF